MLSWLQQVRAIRMGFVCEKTQLDHMYRTTRPKTAYATPLVSSWISESTFHNHHSGYRYSLTNTVQQLNNPLLHIKDSRSHCVKIFLGWMASFLILYHSNVWPTYVPRSWFNIKDRWVHCEGNSVKLVYGQPLWSCSAAMLKDRIVPMHVCHRRIFP